jgi:anthranilate phosphoribosyltransferase
MTTFSALIEKLGRRDDLTTDEAAGAMATIMRGEATPAQIAGLLIGLSMKGERPSELVGFARTMRAEAVALSAAPGDVFDTCGTGGDRSGSFNISTAAALVLAASGVRVAKHGNRSVSSLCGSADVLEALGVKVAAAPDVVERCLTEIGIAFFFAPTFHPAMRHAGQARKELGVRTAFNLLGPLTNPAGPARQIVGVPRPELTELLARALLLLGSTRAWVVHGADGLDELSTTGYTKVSETRDGTVRTFYVHPADYGLAKSSVDALRGGDAVQNAQRIGEVLDGVHGPGRNVVLLNAGAALFVAGHADSVREGIAQAATAIDSGKAKEVLTRLAAVSNDPAVAPGPSAPSVPSAPSTPRRG